jgi:hypothetical protein
VSKRGGATSRLRDWPKGRCPRRCPVPISAAVTRAVLESSDLISLCPCRPGANISPPPCRTHTSHITHAHTKNNETIFYCTCNEGRGGTRGTNANCAKWTTHTSASHPATEPTGRHFGANAASFRDLCTNGNRYPFTTVVILVQEGSKKSPPSHRRLKDPALWARSSRGSFFSNLLFN